MTNNVIAVFLWIIYFGIKSCSCSTWSEWWNYEGISGPSFWGRVNVEWQLCIAGKRQSPIDIQPSELLFDPELSHVHISKHPVKGHLVNTGHDVRLILDGTSDHRINISHGPLPYHYRISDVIMHFGKNDSYGSEHSIEKNYFPMEIQIMGWNSIFGNLSHAWLSNYGLAVMVVFAKIGHNTNNELSKIAQNLESVQYKNQEHELHHFSVAKLLPHTTQYITYEGSLTQPGCQETVTWIILNKPIYISPQDLNAFRQLLKVENGTDKKDFQYLYNNVRPTMPRHHRPIRTNINFPDVGKDCSMKVRNYYQASPWVDG